MLMFIHVPFYFLFVIANKILAMNPGAGKNKYNRQYKNFHLLRHFNDIKYFGDDMILIDILCFSFVCEANPVAHYIVTD
jgi:hypothetical protein